MNTIRRTAPLSALLLLSACASAPHQRKPAEAPAQPIAWVELGPESSVLARVITGAAECPRLQLDGGKNELPLGERVAPNDAYPVRVCEAVVPSGTKSAQLGDQVLPLPVAEPHKILFIGDTGCRILIKDGKPQIQACNDPKSWPFPEMARTEAELKPDLIVHLGDYLYREAACPEGNTQCAGSPWGNNWNTWNADVFAPAAPLLRKAPWVFLRGNHESCKRSGEGWFRFLEPTPYRACTDDTDPYLVTQGKSQLVVLDSALAADLKSPDDQVAMYKRQMQAIAAMPLQHAWLVTHKPFWAPAFDGKGDGPRGAVDSFNHTLQAASQNQLPKGIDVLFAGHLHVFEELHFADGRPEQIVAGIGGTALSPVDFKDPSGFEFAGTRVSSGSTMNDFGYFTLESVKGGSWVGAVFDRAGRKQMSCPADGRSFRCRPPGKKR